MYAHMYMCRTCTLGGGGEGASKHLSSTPIETPSGLTLHPSGGILLFPQPEPLRRHAFLRSRCYGAVDCALNQALRLLSCYGPEGREGRSGISWIAVAVLFEAPEYLIKKKSDGNKKRAGDGIHNSSLESI